MTSLYAPISKGVIQSSVAQQTLDVDPDVVLMLGQHQRWSAVQRHVFTGDGIVYNGERTTTIQQC